MDQQILLILMTVFVAIAAAALAMQAGMLYGIYRSSRAMQEHVNRLAPKIEVVVDASRTTIEESRARIAEISTKTSEILDLTHRQLATVEELLEDAAGRARVQMDRAEMVVDDAMARIQETVKLVNKGVVKPIREINSVAAGIRAALQYMMRRGRPSPDQVTADEEMFI